MKQTRIFSFVALLALLCIPGLSKAQQTLTVYDGTATNSHAPVYGLWADDYLKCEFIIPASELTAMNGGTVSQMDFYLSNSASTAWTGTFQVFFKEVSSTTLSDFFGTAGATTVYTGTLDATGSIMTVPFDNDYTYGGSNLLVGFYQTTIGEDASAYFYGETVSGACVYGQSYSSLDNITATQLNFIPKTTFTYEGGGSPNEWNFGDAMAYCGENATDDGLCGISSSNCDAAAVKYPASMMAGRNYLRSVFINIPDDDDITDFTLRICQEEVNGAPQTSASLFTQTYSWSNFTPGWVELPTPGCELEDNKPLWVIFEIATMTYVETSIHEGNAQLVHRSSGWIPVSELSGYSSWSTSMWAFYAVTSATEPVHADCSEALALPFTCGFESTDNLECWTFIDDDGDGYGWEYYQKPHNGVNGYCSRSYINSTPLTPDNWMFTPKLHIPNGGATLTWWDNGDHVSDYEEHYSVLVSTTGPAITDVTDNLFETTLTEGHTWAQRSVSLADYANQDIYIAFRHHDCTDQLRLLIDDISVTANSSQGIDNSPLSTLRSQLSIYPNPATDVVTVRAEALREVSLLDLNGRVLATTASPRVDVSTLASGVYFLRVVTAAGVTMEKIVKE